eukprot:TRINITY_DN64559_c0_g1_i1.p1 TRINITY_DN64559_c0_g1~~TRINITY_DN64559_c0_g1_i1.p1  ORF type:complete len:582 (-),score=156.65 TRINITY_DN64559_c0_g1_i1:171-1862(-)
MARGPSAANARKVLKQRKQKAMIKDKACSAEAACREKGGYGKSVVSIWDAPAGGIEKSPAYAKMLTRCQLDAKGKPPPPEKRDGAPLKGGFPLDKYPPNVIVDGLRASWVPDDWAQVIKNTGPGGSYLGWMSPAGKFFYHRCGYPSAIEETIGRKLTIKDGLNSLMRNVRNIVKPGADKEFLKECLSAAERKHIPPANKFLFAVVSARRATSESGQHDIMVVEGHFKQVGVKPVWYVDEASLQDYKNLGVNAKVGGKLTPARNMALDDAKKKGLICVQVSDDISKWLYYDCEKQNFKGELGFKKANQALLGVKKHCISPLAAAQFMVAKMRSDPEKPHLAGVFPTANAAMALGGAEFGKQHFILGDFFVAEPASPCRFDTSMTLKEDYDYTCSHLKTHGSVLRCQRMFLHVKHSTNEGGAVANRDNAGQKEKQNIAILQQKWPGVFSINGRRKGIAGSEVVMSWKRYNVSPTAKKGKKLVKALAAKKTVKKVLKDKYPSKAKLRCTGKAAAVPYISKRCQRLDGKTVEDCIGMKYRDASGNDRSYRYSDLKYDIAAGRLEVRK